MEKFFSTRKEEQGELAQEHFDEIHKQREREISGAKRRQDKTLSRKHMEWKQLKESLSQSVQLSRSIVQEDVEIKRQYLEEQGISKFTLDHTTSTIVPIPQVLTQRVKTATSLLQYEQARKELKSYHEQVLSDRIAQLVKTKEVAKQKASNFPSHIAITPIRASQLFSDSITLHSNENLDEYNPIISTELEEEYSRDFPPSSRASPSSMMFSQSRGFD